MHNPRLEEYLKSVESRLNALPPDRRREEVAEIRGHLEALVSGHLAQGREEGEAVDAAIRQFGRAKDLGSDLEGAWLRGHGESIPLWKLGLAYVAGLAAVFGFFTSITAPGDFPYDLGDRLLLSLALTSTSFLVHRAVFSQRGKRQGI